MSTPYWIVVSDEGHSTKPRHHESYDAAKKESERLSKLKPGINFGVFQYIGHAYTPSAETVFKTAGPVGPVIHMRSHKGGSPQWGFVTPRGFAMFGLSRPSAQMALENYGVDVAYGVWPLHETTVV